MGWQFSTASENQALMGSTSVPAIIIPETHAIWADLDDETTFYSVYSLVDKDVGNQRNELYMAGDTANDPIAYAQQSTANYEANQQTNFDTNLNHVLGVAASSTNRKAYLNGTNTGTGATNISPINMDRVSVGHYQSGTEHYGHVNGKLYYAVSWNTNLTATQISQLAAFRHPRNVQSANLKLLWTFQTSTALTDEITGVTLSKEGTPTWVANFCRICTYTGINDNTLDAQSSYSYEGMGFNDTQSTGKIEIGDASTYGACTIKTSQTVTAWDDDTITFTCVRGSLSEGTNYVYVTNSDGSVSPGFAITLSGSDPAVGTVVQDLIGAGFIPFAR